MEKPLITVHARFRGARASDDINLINVNEGNDQASCFEVRRLLRSLILACQLTREGWRYALSCMHITSRTS